MELMYLDIQTVGSIWYQPHLVSGKTIDFIINSPRLSHRALMLNTPGSSYSGSSLCVCRCFCVCLSVYLRVCLSVWVCASACVCVWETSPSIFAVVHCLGIGFCMKFHHTETQTLKTPDLDYYHIWVQIAVNCSRLFSSDHFTDKRSYVLMGRWFWVSVSMCLRVSSHHLLRHSQRQHVGPLLTTD